MQEPERLMDDIADALGMTPDELIAHLGTEIWDEPPRQSHDWRFHVPEFVTKDWWSNLPYVHRALICLMAHESAALCNLDDDHVEGLFEGRLEPSVN